MNDQAYRQIQERQSRRYAYFLACQGIPCRDAPSTLPMLSRSVTEGTIHGDGDSCAGW